MTDDVTIPKTEEYYKNEAFELISTMMERGYNDLHFTNLPYVAEANPKFINGVIDGENAKKIEAAFTKIFYPVTTVSETSVDLYLDNVQSCGHIVAQALNMNIFALGCTVSFLLSFYRNSNNQFVSFVQHRVPKSKSIKMGALRSYPSPEVFLFGKEVLDVYFEQDGC